MRGCSKVVIILSVGILSSSLYGHSGGSGTVDDPYRIASAQDLIALGDTPSDYDKHFVLTADIDLSGYLFDRAVIAPRTGTERYFFEGSRFRGTLNGNGHVIANLRIQGGGFLGLFGRLDGPAVVCNLVLQDAEIEGSELQIGALAGENGSGSIIHCHSTGVVSGDQNVGGLVGENEGGSIAGCHSACAVDGQEAIGGLVGYNSSSIVNCFSAGTVNGRQRVGGFVGRNERGSVSCSYSTGRASGVVDVGGLIGYSAYSAVASGFWDVETSGRTESAGGMGLTSAQMKSIGTYLEAGWDFQGESNNGTSQWWVMPDAGGYPVVSDSPGGLPAVLAGEGTALAPYLISDAWELGAICWFDHAAHFRLVADIDLSGITWPSAVIPSLTGTLDGGGYEIRHLTISGAGYVGLCGMLLNGTIHDVRLTDVHVAGSGSNVGGLVGRNMGTITGSHSSGSVTGSQCVGGLVGESNGDVTDSCSVGSVGGGSYVGGLVGYCYGLVRTGHSYSGGTVSGSTYVGGLLGANRAGRVYGCYSMASVAGETGVGGFIGYDHAGLVSGNYSTGAVSGDEFVGGYVGKIESGSRTRGMWDIETSGMVSSIGAVGLTTAEMMDAKWVGLNLATTGSAWVLDPGRDYPRLAWEGTSGQAIPAPNMDWLAGQGTRADPYQIESVDQLIQISRASVLWAKDLALFNDLDLLGITWSQAVIPSFAGTFQGNGHLIKNLRICGDNYLGLFGCLESKAAVANVGLENVFVTGNGYDVGGLVGISEGEVTESYVTGRITGVENVGGLVGYNGSGSSVASSYNSGAVTGGKRVGGLVGYNRFGSIADSYSAGAVDGDSVVGGLVGDRQGGSVTDCFWDVDASDQAISDGGMGLSTAEMKDLNTFLGAGWDFVGEVANGTDDTWMMSSSVFSDYPRLAWLDYASVQSVEDFEAGKFSLFDWEHAGDAPWTICFAGHQGRFAAGSGTISDDETSILRLTLDCVEGEVRFFLKVSSEASCDHLVFRIDDQQVGRWSGEVDWTEVSHSLDAGQHVFEWEYSKDYSASEGDDMAWIDDVSFPLQ